MTNPNKEWQPDRIAIAEQLYRDNATLSVIAEALQVSRGAIAGISSRQGWRIKYPRKPNKPKPSVRKAKVMPDIVVEPAPIVEPIVMRPLHELPTILEIHDQCCKYWIDDGPPMRFCGEPIIEGRIYCDEHRAKAFWPRTR